MLMLVQAQYKDMEPPFASKHFQFGQQEKQTYMENSMLKHV